MANKKTSKKSSSKKNSGKSQKNSSKNKIVETLRLTKDHDIAMDFAVKVYKKFDKVVKAIVLFGSSTKGTALPNSDIDIMILIDDAAVLWDTELIAWYREELGKLIRTNPYKKNLHINTIKLTSWWKDLMRGNPTLLNILRSGEPLVDVAGFFLPLKHLLIKGYIKSTPEAIYTALQRAPMHLARSKSAQLNSVEGLYWAMVDSAHAALVAANSEPVSPEHIPLELKTNFVNNKVLKMKYVEWYRDLLVLHKDILHGRINEIKGVDIDMWQKRTDEFIKEMTRLVKGLIQ